jgi:hypothetical protein
MKTLSITKTTDVMGELFTDVPVSVYDVSMIDGDKTICKDLMFKSELLLLLEIVYPSMLKLFDDAIRVENLTDFDIVILDIDIVRISKLYEHYKHNISVAKFKTILRNIIKDADVNLDVIYNEMDDVK